MMRLVQILL